MSRKIGVSPDLEVQIQSVSPFARCDEPGLARSRLRSGSIYAIRSDIADTVHVSDRSIPWCVELQGDPRMVESQLIGIRAECPKNDRAKSFPMRGCHTLDSELVWRYRLRSIGAFTLVEVLLVIGLIGLLMAMLMSSITKGKRVAQSLGCISNSKQMALSLAIYADSSGLPNPVVGIGVDWMDLLGLRRHGSSTLATCPVVRDIPGNRRTGRPIEWAGTADMPYRIPLQSGGYSLGAYAYNSWMTLLPPVPTSPGAGSSPRREYYFRDASGIAFPSLAPTFADSQRQAGFVESWSPPARDLYLDEFSDSWMSSLTMARHGSRGPARGSMPVGAGQPLGKWVNNVTFFDGHVEKVMLDDLWRLSWHKGYVAPAARPP